MACIHQLVGLAQYVNGRLSRKRQATAQRHRHAKAGLLLHARAVQHLQPDTLAALHRTGEREAWQDHQKFLPAGTAKQIIATQYRLHLLRQYPQHHIAHIVAEYIIDFLEVINIKSNHAKRTFRMTHLVHQRIQVLQDGTAIEYLGKAVGGCQHQQRIACLLQSGRLGLQAGTQLHLLVMQSFEPADQ